MDQDPGPVSVASNQLVLPKLTAGWASTLSSLSPTTPIEGSTDTDGREGWAKRKAVQRPGSMVVIVSRPGRAVGIAWMQGRSGRIFPVEPRQHLRTLTGLRFVAAALVLLNHSVLDYTHIPIIGRLAGQGTILGSRSRCNTSV